MLILKQRNNHRRVTTKKRTQMNHGEADVGMTSSPIITEHYTVKSSYAIANLYAILIQTSKIFDQHSASRARFDACQMHACRVECDVVARDRRFSDIVTV